MTRRALEACHTDRELCQHFDHHKALIGWRQCGSHRVYDGPTGSVVVPCHGKDVARGTLRSILKMAVLAGLAVIVLVVLL